MASSSPVWETKPTYPPWLKVQELEEYNKAQLANVTNNSKYMIDKTIEDLLLNEHYGINSYQVYVKQHKCNVFIYNMTTRTSQYTINIDGKEWYPVNVTSDACILFRETKVNMIHCFGHRARLWKQNSDNFDEQKRQLPEAMERNQKEMKEALDKAFNNTGNTELFEIGAYRLEEERLKRIQQTKKFQEPFPQSDITFFDYETIIHPGYYEINGNKYIIGIQDEMIPIPVTGQFQTFDLQINIRSYQDGIATILFEDKTKIIDKSEAKHLVYFIDETNFNIVKNYSGEQETQDNRDHEIKKKYVKALAYKDDNIYAIIHEYYGNRGNLQAICIKKKDEYVKHLIFSNKLITEY
jgi:hypothetical protein